MQDEIVFKKVEAKIKFGVLISLISAIVLILAALVGQLCYLNARNADRQEILYYSGTTTTLPGVINFQIASFDGGKHWYAVRTGNGEPLSGKNGKDYELTVVGEAEKVYPGILAYKQEIDASFVAGRKSARD